MLPKWAIEKAKRVDVDELLILVKEYIVPKKMLGPIARLVARLASSELSNRQRLAILGAFIYLITFWDVIPDAPIIGFVDDFAVIMSVLKQIDG